MGYAMFKTWKAKIEAWYEGEYRPYENDANSMIVIIGGTYDRHWTAEVARALVDFWYAHWQWTIGTCIALVGLGIALKKLS